jgi:hypothetical protein
VNKLFPTVIVDDFLEDPDYIRNRALQMEFFPTNGTYPGKRTTSLNEIDPELFDCVCKKFFAVHYDFLNPVEWNLSVYFQLIEPFSDDKQNSFNHGWIHRDYNKILAGILYLTPDADPDSGTSLFKPKTPEVELVEDEQSERNDLYNNKEVDLECYTKRLHSFNSNFIETIRIKNIYNRLISFDSNEWHGANNFQTGTGSRLTMVYFVDTIKSLSIPAVERVRRCKL